MTLVEILDKVKFNLEIKDDKQDLLISDVILSVCDYCNISQEDFPDILESFIRKKVKGIVDYEAAMGRGYTPEVASVKEGDGSVTWALTEGNTKASIYGLSDTDKGALRRYRRLRGYD